MKTITFAITLLTALTLCRVAEARAYVPLQKFENAPASLRSPFLPVNPDARPFLPGMRPVAVELLEDALRRKQPRTIGASLAEAHASIIRNSLRDPVKRSHMRGMLAEALYLEKNPDWGYVRKPNAPQHDLYARIQGRETPFTAQVKTHASADPSRYARDMVGDYRSNLFLVPDDHVAPLKDHWRNQIRELNDKGLAGEAVEARRQLARIRELGFTAKELDDHLMHAARYCIRERNATYVSLGAGVAMALGPDLWEWWQKGSLNDKAMSQMVRSASIIATERTTAFALEKFATGALRGGLRGNVISGLVIFATDAGFSIYENGGSKAFRNTEFYAHMGGSVGGLTLGFAVGTPVTLSVTGYFVWTGWWAPVIGGAAGLASGGIAGTAGYIGGESATRKILEAVNPDFLHDAENAALNDAHEHLSASIAMLQQDIATVH